MLFLPLILIELYLIFSLSLLAFGPITFTLGSPEYFWLLMLLYHSAFIFGYLLYATKFNNRTHEVVKPTHTVIDTFVTKYFWLFIFLAFAANIIAYKNALHNTSYIPYNFFSDFYNGLVSPGLRRGELYASDNFKVGNKSVTMFLAIIGVIKFSLIPIVVIYWNKMKAHRKLIALFISLIPLISGVSTGTNKPIFDTFLVFAVVIMIQKIASKNDFTELAKFSKRKKKIIIVLILSLFVFVAYYFNKSMSDRAADFTYMENTTISGNIVVPTPETPFDNFSQKVSVYLVQGYYGMSLALDEEFDTTFGIGHSIFLLDQFKYFFGLDLIPYTYQQKINDDWHRLVQWHSFYSQMANDVSFPGVAIIMFILGYVLAVFYISAIKYQNTIAKILMPIFAIMFLYMPMNNQIFNFLETLFSFYILVFLWLINRIRMKRIN